MQKTKIGIIGYGVVGQATANGFKEKGDSIIFYDKYKKSSSIKEVAEKSDFIFICLPTPYKGSKIDLSIIDENIAELVKYTNGTDKIIVLKSTIVPGSTEKYAKKYPKSIFAFNPEFLTEANAFADFLNPDRIVIGSKDKKALDCLDEFYADRFPGVPIYRSDAKTAEMVKYMANCFLATKVIFANEFNDLCQKLGINYTAVKGMVIADPRIGKSHLDITSVRGFGGKCFPKDTIAILGMFDEAGVDSALLSTVWAKNLKIRKVRDWDDIPFVKS
ncbi:MAG: NAD(P)-dependent oxidoreductase [Candidatus Paceibacterota bacterium]|jgi:UDPglucose 6-dehydrogenase